MNYCPYRAMQNTTLNIAPSNAARQRHAGGVAERIGVFLYIYGLGMVELYDAFRR